MTLNDSIDLAKVRLYAAIKSYAMIPRREEEKEYDLKPEKIASWQFMLSSREAAFDLLASLPTKKYDKAESHKYEPDRFLAALAYLSVHWALCDSITSWVGKALCYDKKAHVEKDSLKLPKLPTFIPDRLAIWIRDDFGYAIALSYQIRNCFVHDGGFGFFQGPDQGSRLTVHEGQWNYLHQKCPEVKENLLRRRSAFKLAEAERDLGVVLKCCEAEIDEALGTLLVSACTLIDGHLGFLAASAIT